MFFFFSFNKETLCYKWIIKDAETILIQVGKSLKSPAFKIPGVATDFSFCLTLSHYYGNYYLFKICMNKIGDEAAENVWVINCDISVLNQDSDMVESYAIQNIKFINLYKEEKIKSDAFRNLLRETLTIRVTGLLMITNSPVEFIDQVPVTDQLSKMELMYEKKLFSDIQIEVGNKTFNAHRAILASHSEVFEKMFEINMKEKEEGRVIISDIDAEVMSDLLAFMYTGRAPNMRAHTTELLLAADKYNLQDLIGMCVKEAEEEHYS